MSHHGPISHSGPIVNPGEIVVGRTTSHYQPGMHLPSGSRPQMVMQGPQGVPADFGGQSVMVPHSANPSAASPEIIRTPAKVQTPEPSSSKPIFKPRSAAVPRVGQASYQTSRPTSRPTSQPVANPRTR